MAGTETLDVEKVRSHPAVREAERRATAGHERTLEEQAELTRIPAPPFGEERRGARVAELFGEVGLREVRRDRVGNVLGLLGSAPPREGAEPGLVVLSAHLDTVFPAHVDIDVRREGPLLEGPGISDNGRGLAVLLAVARALAEAGVRPAAPLLFAATVGEEGEGNLRGVRHLFRPGSPLNEAGAFVALDGAGLASLVVRAIGSVRLRAVARGPGGHSWADRGTPNPMAALGRGVAELTEVRVPARPPSSLTVTRWGGGTGINAVPEEAWVEMDLRSEGEAELAELRRETARRLEEAVEAESRRGSRRRGRLDFALETVGERPVAATDPRAALVEAARSATRLVGANPRLVAASTDANVPMARGIPSVAMGGGGDGGGAHTLREWYRDERGPEGVVRALLTVMALAGAER